MDQDPTRNNKIPNIGNALEVLQSTVDISATVKEPYIAFYFYIG